MKTTTFLLLIACCLFVGCAKKVRSISQSGYNDHYHHAGPHNRELDEFDVLGLDPSQPVTEEEIRRVSSQSKTVQLAPGSTILLVQSGAIYPDAPMVAELSKQFRVVPFTGVASERSTAARTTTASKQRTRNAIIVTDSEKPATVVPLTTLAKERYPTDTPREPAGDYSRVLRLAAARAGASVVVCYWGILESGTEDIATKTVSWMPVLRWVVPDERQHARIRLKIAVVDVPTGSWTVFSAQPIELKSWSVRPRREVADQKQVESLKQQAYELAARDLIAAYSGATVIR
ncbi:MAG: hypothetical protein KIS67_06150 [Verrucomicrobiae bacterium]|nr:hypothetical protein [Verrucomicrobiae bacterium]